METRDMVRMANQIGEFFKGYGTDAATKDVAAHINSFWEPRMRHMFISHMDKGGDGLSDIVKLAAADVRRPAIKPDHDFHPDATGG